MADTNQANKDEMKNTVRRPAVVVSVVLIALVIFVAGLFAGHLGGRHQLGGPGPLAGRHAGFGMGHGGAKSAHGARNENRITGVVTAVNDKTLTIAGSGSTNTVQTADSTQYQGGSKANVNDTVVVFGTNNEAHNGTFTATRIVINP